MTINELGAGRSRRRIVVNARPLDFRPVALAWRVVDGQQYPTLRHDHADGDLQHDPSQPLDLAANARDEVIIVLVILAQLAGAQPTRHGAPSTGEQQPAQEWQQS